MEQVLLALFVGKTHRVMTRLFRLAADLAALHLLTCLRGSKIAFWATRPYYRDQEARQAPILPWSPYCARCPCYRRSPIVLQSRAARRTTLASTDSSSTGFTRTGALLSMATIEQPSRKHNLVSAGAKARYHAQLEKDTEFSPTDGCVDHGGDHWGGIHGCILCPKSWRG